MIAENQFADSGARVIIIGAGPTGLGAAYRLNELGIVDFTLLEASSAVGGLARSIIDEHGFTWDIGGHVGFSQFERYNEIAKKSLNDGWNEIRRNALIYMQGRYIAYPFQRNVHMLSRLKSANAALGLFFRRYRTQENHRNFKEWSLQNFGKAITKLFMEPYNEKVWGYPTNQLGTQWIEHRVAPPNPGSMIWQAIAGNREPNWGPNATFRYPIKGGTGALWSAIAAELPTDALKLQCPVTKINLNNQIVECPAGKIDYDILVSTIPLKELGKLTAGECPDIEKESKKLLHSAVQVMGFGFEGPPPSILNGLSWVYFPEDSFPFHRVSVLSNYSRFNVGGSKESWSLLTETTETALRPVDSDRLQHTALNALKRASLVPDDVQPISVWQHREEYGYPTPTINRDDVLKRLLSTLEEKRVYSRGRFGAWRYEISNQDHCFMQGIELIDRLFLGESESILESRFA